MKRLIFASYELERLCRRRRGVVFCVILAAAFLARLAGLGERPFWNDEAFSLLAARGSLSTTWSIVSEDVHPPLYYLILNLYLAFGDGEFWARALSAMAGSLSVAMVYAIARLFLGPFASLAAMALAMVHPLLFGWSQIARGYALFTLAGLIASWGALHLLRALPVTRTGASPEPHRRWLAMAAFIGGSAAALWINNLFVFGVAGFSAVWVLIWLSLSPRRRQPLIQWTTLNATILLLWLPWLPTLIRQSGALDRGHFRVGFASIPEGFLALMGSEHLWRFKLVFGGLLGAVLIAGTIALCRQAWRSNTALILACFTPIILCSLAFALGETAFGYAVGRLMWLSGLLVIIMAAILQQPRTTAAASTALPKTARRPLRLLSGGLVAAIFLGMAYASWNWTSIDFPAHDRAARRIASMAKAGDAVVLPMAVPASAGQREEGTAPRHALHYYWLETGNKTVEPIYPAGAAQQDLVAVLCRFPRTWFTRIPGDSETSLANRLIQIGANSEQFSVTKVFYLGAIETFTLSSDPQRCAI